MKAMILAAGLGTRLKPLTDTLPKALVEVEGVPMLERIILTLKKQGFDYIVVNVHHFSNKIIDYLESHNYGVDIKISDESTELLDTGGGIVKAFDLLFAHDEGPVLVHNVDILSNANLSGLVNISKDETVLLVSDRESSRKLIFNPEYKLLGWHDLKNEKFRPENRSAILSSYLKDSTDEKAKELAFSGIYSITKKAVEEMRQKMGKGKFSVMEYFLLPDRVEPVFGLEDRDLKLIDIGKPATLSQASDFVFF